MTRREIALSLIVLLTMIVMACAPVAGAQVQGAAPVTYYGTVNGYNHYRIDHADTTCYTLGTSISCLRK